MNKLLRRVWDGADAGGILPLPLGNLRPDILVLQPTQDGHCQRLTDGLDGAGDWRVSAADKTIVPRWDFIERFQLTFAMHTMAEERAQATPERPLR